MEWKEDYSTFPLFASLSLSTYILYVLYLFLILMQRRAFDFQSFSCVHGIYSSSDAASGKQSHYSSGPMTSSNLFLRSRYS
jgi:hypothetical protein